MAVAALCLHDTDVGLDISFGRFVVDPCLFDAEPGLLDAVPGLLVTEPG